MEIKPIYLDYNATTPVAPEVADAMKPFLDVYFGNPSSTHTYGVMTRKAVIEARQKVAALLNCRPEEIIFTSGGTESNNLAIKGVAYALRKKGNHIITSVVEHPAVSEVCRFLEGEGFEVTWLPVNDAGLISIDDLKKAIRPETILISVMHANNEVGTIQPVEEIGRIAAQHGIIFHSDAAQSVGKIEVDVQKMGVSLLSVAGHKLYAPKGIGALFIRQGTPIQKLLHGADHERNLRPGTENILEIAGLGEACRLAAGNLEQFSAHMKEMRDRLQQKLTEALPDARVNGDPALRLPNTLNISFPGVKANTLLSELEQVAASAGAACHAEDIDVSPVLEAMKLPVEYAMGTLRLSTGRNTTVEEIDKAAAEIIRTVKRLRGEKPEVPSGIVPQTKLTRYTHGLGCACKIRPQYLERVLHDLPVVNDPAVLVDMSTSDDAAVYKINDELALVQTVDFFTPVVDDPYDFGAIAAANSLSDIYAMGARPLYALNIVGFPDQRLPEEVLIQILKGASDTAAQAGIAIIGGHTVEDTEPKFGLSVTGMLHPDKIWMNQGVRPGDKLILTKPLGTGVLSTALKRGLLSDEEQQTLILLMKLLNKYAADLLKDFHPSAVTDVTGFGLLGHLSEMAGADPVKVTLYAGKVPLLPGAMKYASENIVPGGTMNNYDFVKDKITFDDSVHETLRILLCDAQTNGGLLVSLPGEIAGQYLDTMNQKEQQAWQIGEVDTADQLNIIVKA
ncbi:MAG: hypothetical protein Kow00127_03580 [Bacteroidales bacterium]